MSSKKNILLICADQHRQDCVGYAKGYPVKTPNIDRIANEGIRFNRAYTPNPICVPARRSLICSKRPESFGTLCNDDQGIPMLPFTSSAFSWARELQRAGYYNGYIGEWHVSHSETPQSFGYDDYVPVSALTSEYGKYPSDTSHGFFGDASAVPLECSRTHKAADEAIRMMKDAKDRPWHIRLNFTDPHLPCRPSEPFASMYPEVPKWAAFDDDLKNKPFMQRQMLYNWNNADRPWEDYERMVKLYYGMISQLDDAVGKVLSYLESVGEYENTLVIYTSDHGDMTGERRMLDKHYIMYDSVVRVPFCMRVPKLEGGIEVNEPVYSMLDLGPTLLEYAGCETPEGLHGKSLLPYMEGKEPLEKRKYALVTYNGQQFGLYTQRMICDTEYKYVWNLSDKDELYNTKSDPAELYNLASSEDPEVKEILSRMRKDMIAELDAVQDYTMRSPWLRDQLLYNRKAN